MRTKLILAFCVAVAAGCGGGYYRGSVGYRSNVAVSASTPDLAYVSPGVYVIANYDEPIFYSSGYYWYPYNGGWYRSTTYTGGWVYASPPHTLARIQSPYVYRQYRPSGYVVRNRPVPVQRIERPVVRDHRARQSPYRRRY